MARRVIAKKNSRKMKKLEPTGIVKWTKDLIVTGILKEIRVSPNNKFQGEGYLLDLVSESGAVVTYGCPTILRNYMRQVEPGEYVEIKCVGKVRTPRGKAWDFEVSIEDTSIDEDDASQDAE